MTVPSNRVEVFNQQFSCMGPLVFPVTLDFSVNTVLEVDFTSLVQRNVVDFISGFWTNIIGLNETITVRCNASRQLVTVPENSQGYFPLMLSNAPVITFEVANVIATPVIVQFYNIPFVPIIDKPAGGGGGGTTDINIDEIGGVSAPAGFLPVDLLPITITEFALVLDGNDQELIPAGDAMNYFLFQNTAANPVTINLAGNDASVTGSIILPGGVIELSRGTLNAIHVAGTNADNIIAWAA